jgi:hypothetical protein
LNDETVGWLATFARAGGDAAHFFREGEMSLPEFVTKMNAFDPAERVNASYLVQARTRPAELLEHMETVRTELRQAYEALHPSDKQLVDWRKEPGLLEKQRHDAVSWIRDIGSGTRGGKYEGYVPDRVLVENQVAVKSLKEGLRASGATHVIAQERGGALLGEIVAHGDADIEKAIVRVDKQGPNQEGKLEQIKLAIQKLYDEGHRNIGFIDAYIGGATAEGLANQVFGPLVQTHDDLVIHPLWLRETLARVVRGEGKVVISPGEYGLPIGSQGANRVVGNAVPVNVIFGDDIDLIVNRARAAREPIRIFDQDGRIARVIVPKQGDTTRSLAIRLLNGDPLIGY